MFCMECGTKLPDAAKYCMICGTKVGTVRCEDGPSEEEMFLEVAVVSRPVSALISESDHEEQPVIAEPVEESVPEPEPEPEPEPVPEYPGFTPRKKYMVAKPVPLTEEELEAGMEPQSVSANKISLEDGSMVCWLDTRWNIGHPDNYEIREDGRKTFLVKKTDRDKKYEELNNWSLYRVDVRGVHEYLNSGASRGIPDAWFLQDGNAYWRDTDSTWYKVHIFDDEPAEEVGQVPEWDAMEF